MRSRTVGLAAVAFAVLIAFGAASADAREGDGFCYTCRFDDEIIGCFLGEYTPECWTECGGEVCTCSGNGPCAVSLLPGNITPAGTSLVRAGAEVAAGEDVVRGCAGVIVARRYPDEKAARLRVQYQVFRL